MKKLKISFVLNIVIVLLVILGSIFMFTEFKFMPGVTLLEQSKLGMFKFFTVDSNILACLSSLVFVLYERKMLLKKIDAIPNSIYILKHISTTSVSLTFIITLLFLVPQYGFYAMYNNSNLFFHLLVPLLSIISYIFYEKYDNKYKYSLLGIIPVFLYSIYYTFMIIVHLNNGGLTYKYDFYGFLNGNINNIYITIPIIYLLSYLLSLILILLNKKIIKR